MWVSNPTSTLTGEWLMTIVNDILKQMPGLGQPQRKFLATLFFTILVLRGRVNFRNLSRYCDYSERTIARQFREPFDWPDFHQRVLMTALDSHSELVSAHDASFIPKSGKQTFGLGHFFNGCASRAERGLEISTLAVVDVTRRCALTLAVSQTPPGEEATQAEPEETRVDFYKQQLRAHRHRLPSGITYHCVDGYYTYCISSNNSAIVLSYQRLPTSIQCGEAMARRRKSDGRVGSASRGMVRRWGRFFSRVRHRDVSDRERVPARCHASGAAVDICSDAP